MGTLALGADKTIAWTGTACSPMPGPEGWLVVANRS